jgi:hypothetical protein
MKGKQTQQNPKIDKVGIDTLTGGPCPIASAITPPRLRRSESLLQEIRRECRSPPPRIEREAPLAVSRGDSLPRRLGRPAVSGGGREGAKSRGVCELFRRKLKQNAAAPGGGAAANKNCLVIKQLGQARQRYDFRKSESVRNAR